MTKTHHANDLIHIFNHLFKDTENTVLIGGAAEPLYLPCDETYPHHRVVLRSIILQVRCMKLHIGVLRVPSDGYWSITAIGITLKGAIRNSNYFSKKQKSNPRHSSAFFQRRRV